MSRRWTGFLNFAPGCSRHRPVSAVERTRRSSVGPARPDDAIAEVLRVSQAGEDPGILPALIRDARIR